ncbi:MAG: hypothetical protein KBC84_07895, partial [Proteobacteria bacterium]|nr:hypothetical protein [Pseudomonadota bacterium]
MQINQQKPNTPQNVPQVQEQEKPKRPEPNLVLKLPLTDEQIIEQLLKMERSYKDLSPEHKSKKNIIEAATYIDANNVKHLPKDIDIIFNESFISKLVRANGYVLTIGLKEKILPDYYKDDKLLWLDAISNSPELIKQLPHNLLNTDKEIHNFLKAGIVRNPDIYKFLANEFKGNKLIALSLINTNQGARYFEEIPEQLRMDQTFFQQALALNGELFKYVKDKSNTSLILTAVASDSSIIRDVPLETLRNPILQKDLIQTSINARREMITRGITISKVAEDAYQNMKFAYDTLSIDLRMRDKNSQTVDVKYFD